MERYSQVIKYVIHLNKFICSPRFKECELLQKSGHNYNQIFGRLLARLVLKVTFDQKSRQKVYKLWDNRERRVDDLISHEDKIDRLLHLPMTFDYQYLMEQFDKLFNVKMSMDDMWHWFGILKINSMKVGHSKLIWNHYIVHDQLIDIVNFMCSISRGRCRERTLCQRSIHRRLGTWSW